MNRPELHDPFIVLPTVGEPFNAEVSRILGQYIYIGSGRFHFLDDRVDNSSYWEGRDGTLYRAMQ